MSERTDGRTGERTGHVHLAAGGFTAHVDPLGAALAGLRHGDREMVMGYDEGEERPAYAGSVLVPWPNRLGGGRYTFAGTEHRAPLNDPDHPNAMHGLLDPVTTTVADRSPGHVSLTTTLPAGEAYPSELTVLVTYRLDDDGLSCTVRATNAGGRGAPYGVGTHPYLVAGPGPVDRWSLLLPAATAVELDGQQLPTTRRHDVAEAGVDVRTPLPLAGLQLDHLLTDVQPGTDGTVTAELRADDGAGVAISADASWARWWQVFTGDTVPAPRRRTAVAVEPMSCPGDAFRSGTDLVVLQPGDVHEVSWRISPLAP